MARQSSRSRAFLCFRLTDQSPGKNMTANIQTFDARSNERGAEYFLPPDVILVTVEDGSARLLDMAGGFHAVPAVGARMLQETLTSGAAAAATRIAEDYRVDRRQVQ